jgi:hypothetical protein
MKNITRMCMVMVFESIVDHKTCVSKGMQNLAPKIHLSYPNIASSNTSRLEAHAGFFRLLMKGIFYPYLL